MANNLVTKLQNIGNALRKKTGKTIKFTLDAMPEEIENIGGDAYLEYSKKFVNKTFPDRKQYEFECDKEVIPTATPCYPSNKAFYGFSKFSVPNLQKCYPFFFNGAWNYNSSSPQETHFYMDEVEFPSVTEISGMAFMNVAAQYTDIKFPELTMINALDTNQFISIAGRCAAGFIYAYFRSMYFPKLLNTASVSAGSPVHIGFYYVSWVNFYLRDVTEIQGSSTTYCLTHVPGRAKCLVIDKTTPPTLTGQYLCNQAYNSSSNPWYNGQAKIYVPASALETYKKATNWSAYRNAMVAIEDSETDLKGIWSELDEKYFTE